MRILFTSCLCIKMAFVCPSAVAADKEQESSFRMGGLLFGDSYFIPSHHLDTGEDAVGLVLRRGYLTFNADMSEKSFGRLRFELNQSGEFETYTYRSAVKDLYLGWNLGRHQLIAGLTSTITYDLVESIWGARYLARTPMDLQGVASRDTGVSLRGPLNATGSVSYRFMLGSGLEFGADSSNSAKWMAALTWKPSPGWTVDLYTDFEDLHGPDHRLTLQAFVAYQTETFRWGLQYSNQDRQDSPPIELASAFVVKTLAAKTEFIGRIDRLFEPSPRGNDIAYLPMDPSARATLIFTGLKVQMGPHWSLTPNTVFTLYDRNDQGVRPKKDVYLRLTLFVDFE